MSRSKHTRPLSIRAPERLRRPREPRGAGDRSRQRQLRRRLEALGLHLAAAEAPPARRDWPLPRIHASRPRPGHAHPASAADVRRFLRALGAPSCYGVRAIELRQGSARPGRALSLGRLLVPGRILLFDQPPSPWRLEALPAPERRRLEEAGARVDDLDGRCEVHWPGDTLRWFLLADVLLHELGHHQLQHHTGKRSLRIARTRDHEAFAESFARRQRRALGARA